MRITRRRGGFSYLEVQVSLALFMIAISGLGPLAVIQSRQIKQIERRFAPGETHFLNPTNDRWLRKLGAVASVRSEPPSSPAPAVTLIDNGDPQYYERVRDPNHWLTVNTSNAYGGSVRGIEQNQDGNMAAWVFRGLDPGVYEIYITYPNDPILATNTPVRVFDGRDLLVERQINQRSAPAGNVFEGFNWDSLGEFNTNTGFLSVRMAPMANGHVAADAVRIEPRRNQVTVDSVVKTNDTKSMSATVTVTSW